MSDKRKTMNGKPVFEVPAQSVVNWQSGFGHKLLCDSLTFSTGSACAYSCQFCYVPALMTKSPHMEVPRSLAMPLEDVVIRRTNAVEALRSQLIAAKEGKGKNALLFEPSERPRVIYSSPLVDVAANKDLCDETLAACLAILELSPWTIRLLSKSNMLPRIAAGIPEKWKSRIIYGVSTGTLNNDLARAFEQGTPLVSKRIESLHQLQDTGHRTFGMICPSLPMPDNRPEAYEEFAREMYLAIRGDRCEHTWAEVINLRGDSMTRTVNALMEGGFSEEANALARVSTDKKAWEDYSRATFVAHAPFYAQGKLRFLQYVNNENIGFWMTKRRMGAVLLGKAAGQSEEPATEEALHV